jgi:hypothetical protein
VCKEFVRPRVAELGAWWCAVTPVRVNPNCTIAPPFILPTKNPRLSWALAGYLGHLAWPLLMESGLGHVPLWAAGLVADPVSFKETSPLLFLFSLQF